MVLGGTDTQNPTIQRKAEKDDNKLMKFSSSV